MSTTELRPGAAARAHQHEPQLNRLALEQLPAILWTTDADLRFTSIIGGLADALGYTHEHNVGRTLYEVFGSDDDATPIAQHLKALAGEAVNYEIEWKGRVFNARVEPLREPSGDVNGCAGIAFDITEQKQTEQALRESERRYRILIEQNSDGVIIFDRRGHILDVNTRTCELTGFGCEDFIGHSVTEFLTEEELGQAPVRLGALLAGETVMSERRVRRRDGGHVHIAISARMVDDGRILATLRDVTEHKKSVEQLRLLLTALEQASEVVYLTTGYDGEDRPTILYANPAFAAVTGYDTNEAAGQSPLILEGPKTDKEEMARLKSELRAGRGYRGELTFHRKGGAEFLAELHISPVRDDSGAVTHYVSIMQDVTERRSQERHLQQILRVDAVGRLAGGIAHDFRNILMAVNGYSDMILRSLPEADPNHRRAKQIKLSGMRGAALTSQFLAFSRQQILQPKVIDLNAIVTTLAVNSDSMLRRLIREDIDLVINLSPTLGRVKADPTQVEQILVNLAVNASDAMPQGGRLLLETGETYLDDAYARQHHPTKPGHYVMLAVTDTGTGMDEATVARIFEPYFTTKEVGKGTGLGLATVYGIVKQSGGYVWVYSEPGLGTTFKVYLPRVDAPPDALAQPDEPADTADVPRGTETILLVEDDMVVRQLIRETLEMWGYTVLEASSGQRALNAHRGHDQPIDLVLTDVVMPGMSGRELVRQLAETHKDLRVVYMSGWTNNAIVQHGVLDANVHFVQKPVAPEELARKIREALDSAPRKTL